MSVTRAPKQWQLTRKETVSSFESWRQNLLYILSLDPNFAPFLVDGFTWQKKSAQNPTRGFTDDPVQEPPDPNRKTAVQKNALLELMLGQIANYCSIVSRNTIVKTSTSLSNIWQKLREHYGFQSSGAHFLDLSLITRNVDESHEDLYQRLVSFFEDNLLSANGGLTHHGERITSDEELTPTLENDIVLRWLQLLHPGLPQLVKQKYGAELRNRTLASIKPEISQAMTSLLDELRAMEDAKVLRAESFTPKFSKTRPRGQANWSRSKTDNSRSCTLCKAAGREYRSHYLSKCKFLPDSDRRALARSCTASDDEAQSDDSAENSNYDIHSSDYDPGDNALLDPPPTYTARRVNILQSPTLSAFFGHTPVLLTLDTGATSNMVLASFAKSVGMTIRPTSQTAYQADGVTRLRVLGEVNCSLTRDHHTFQLDALVVEQLDSDILAGSPFLTHNDIAIRQAKNMVVIKGRDVVTYGPKQQVTASARRAQAQVLRGPKKGQVILPGQYLDLEIPSHCFPDSEWALEPRLDSPSNSSNNDTPVWPSPQGISSVSGHIRIPNHTNDPILIRKHEHVCQIRSIIPTPASSSTTHQYSHKPHSPEVSVSPNHSDISVDPDHQLSDKLRSDFTDLHRHHAHVFHPDIHKYNGASGKIEAKVNMGQALPPQRKGRMPQYSKDKMDELQDKCDELEIQGVFAKPEDVGVTVEYLNLPFLVNKPGGGTRLVTSFGEIAKYCKPQPSLMPDMDSVLRAIGGWKLIIKTDLLKAYLQIPLSRASMKYCGIATPYKGIRVYTRAAMGLPGSETCLEELMARVLGDMIREGFVVKLADDLYIGANSETELYDNWARVLSAFQCNNLGLSASKTVICPKTTTILGWIWSRGSLKASPHRIASLSTVSPPQTVHGLRSFIGAYKVLSRVLPSCATLLDPLESLCAGKQSKEAIEWTSDSVEALQRAQSALQHNKQITIPRSEDILWIVCDASVARRGISATLYVLRHDSLKLAGFFNAKLKKHQVSWLPCEVEALAICAAVRHFAPFIIQSDHVAQVLTDNRPCIQAYEKLRRGQFSNSARVTTFLSTLCRYQVELRHIAGVANLPSDFGSRNPTTCTESSCQICKFVHEAEDSVVRSLSVHDVCVGGAKMPFTNRSAWHSTQQECPNLRRTHAHLSQGTRPSRKVTKIPDVKRYLRQVTIANDGLLVVPSSEPFQPTRQLIVVPKGVLGGLLTALHIRFNHPSAHQLKKVFSRYFFALSIDKALTEVSATCHHCTSLKSVPTQFQPQSSQPPPDCIGVSFAADVMRRCRQFIFVLRETVSSFTVTCIIPDERHESLRDALIMCCAEIRSLGDSGSSVRVDPAPGLVKLKNDPMLSRFGIELVVGNAKNPNKNPVAEHAIRELGSEFLNISPEGGPVTKVTLALATANLNGRLRESGLSSREIWTQRDQFSGEQLPIVDRLLILNQSFTRSQNHFPSAKSKAHGKTTSIYSEIAPGDLVYLYGDRDKNKARDRYLVVSVSDTTCQVRKFTQSQFRLKLYDVPISQCYKVKQIVTSPDLPGPPIRELDDHGCQEIDIYEPVSSDSPQQTVNEPIGLPPPINEPVGLPPEPVNSDSYLHDHNAVDPIESHHSSPRRHMIPEPESDERGEESPQELSLRSPPEIVNVNDSSVGDGPRRSSRKRHSPIYLKDYITN